MTKMRKKSHFTTFSHTRKGRWKKAEFTTPTRGMENSSAKAVEKSALFTGARDAFEVYGADKCAARSSLFKKRIGLWDSR